MRYLEGKNLAPRSVKDARSLIGKRVKYLFRRDIDRSGRGYFFPQYGVVADVFKLKIAMDDPTNFVGCFRDIVELVVLEE